ncbi:carbohydrate-binding protein [Micromonospora sp. NPDC047707]|uniref:carbohydrate-binding protein n=1 Tax=Micromonospora sp. NPDC047707 TaxID=3154498 RepID=UPI003456C087
MLMSPSRPRRRSRLLHAVLLAFTTTAVVVGAQSPVGAHSVDPADYQAVQLASGSGDVGQPMSLALLPNLSVVHTARDGTIRITDKNGNTSVAGKLTVYTHDEEGLQGVGVDPNFTTNRYIYLYYSPKLSTPSGDAPKTGTQADWNAWKGEFWLSRFVLKTDNTLDLASEKVVLKVPSDRGLCCHAGGDIDFDAQGNLYLTTGDDTNPFESSGSAPIDERADRNPQFDAQRTSANTNDLRGKLLRIKVNADGSYSIPTGNLFAPGTTKTRPEIYAMGFRNPFRMSVDKPTGIVYLGEYGPDGGAVSGRGPAGQVEFNRITGPGNFGWPYCTGLNTTAETYWEWTFPSGPATGQYNCAAPVNNSFRNTGLTNLPAAKPSWIRYGGSAGSPPEFGSGSESPMGGQVYRYNAASSSTVKFPQELNGHYFAAEYGRKWIKVVDINSDGSYGAINNFPWSGGQIIDTAFGSDGAFYVLDYGGNNATPGIYRIEYIGGGNKAPQAVATANKTSGPAPLTVAFSSAGSSDPDGGALTYSWNFGDGTSSTAANPTKTFNSNGTYAVTLTVRDPQGATGTANVTVTVGNTAPTVTFQAPTTGTLFSFGDTVPFQIGVTDPEETSIDCTKVTLAYLLGHDEHAHQITSKTGCSGTITIPVDGEHDETANIYGVLQASYTDTAGATGTAQVILQPRHRQAEHYSTQSGVQKVSHSNAEGGTTVGYVNNGDWIAFQPYRLSNATAFTARASSAGAGGTIQVRYGSATGTLLGSVTVPVTGNWNTFTEVSTALTAAPNGTGPLYLVFTGGTGSLFDLDAFTFATGSTEAESFSSQSGVQVANHVNANGGKTVGYINDGDWTGYAAVSTAGKTSFTARVSSATTGGTIQIRSGSATGTLLGSVSVPTTGGWGTFQSVSTTLTSSASGPLYLVYRGSGTGYLFDVDSFVLS